MIPQTTSFARGPDRSSLLGRVGLPSASALFLVPVWFPGQAPIHWWARLPALAPIRELALLLVLGSILGWARFRGSLRGSA